MGRNYQAAVNNFLTCLVASASDRLIPTGVISGVPAAEPLNPVPFGFEITGYFGSHHSEEEQLT
jgi:hypothetical protein